MKISSFNPSLPTGWTRTRPSISIGKAHTSIPGCRDRRRLLTDKES
jgi:hypothetical protein